MRWRGFVVSRDESRGRFLLQRVDMILGFKIWIIGIWEGHGVECCLVEPDGSLMRLSATGT